MPPLDRDLAAKPPCHPRACAIQDCIQKNNYDEGKCQGAVRALYECCKAFYDRNGSEARSTCCPLPDLLQLKFKQLDQGK